MPIVVYLHAVIDPNMHLDVSMSGRERIGYGKCMNFPFLFDVGDHELSAFFFRSAIFYVNLMVYHKEMSCFRLVTLINIRVA